MKKIFIISILFVSCTKTYKCTVSTNFNNQGWIESGTVNFTGTKEEMKEYEQKGSINSSVGMYSYDTKTECK